MNVWGDTLDYDLHEFLKNFVRDRGIILIVGLPNSGKTSMLNTLIDFIPANSRIISIEQHHELNFSHENVVSLLIPSPQTQEKPISQLHLINFSLRLSPDVLVVDDLRIEDVNDFTRYMSRNDAILATLEAKDISEAINRFKLDLSIIAPNLFLPMLPLLFIQLIKHPYVPPQIAKISQLKEVHPVYDKAGIVYQPIFDDIFEFKLVQSQLLDQELLELVQEYPIQEVMSLFVPFQFELFQKIIDKSFGENIFISPLNVILIFMLLYNGANGESKKAIAQVFQFDLFSVDTLNLAYYALLREFQELGNNAVWAMQGQSLWYNSDLIGLVEFNADFIQLAKKNYLSEITSISFKNPNTTSVINKWVNQKTVGKISKLIDSLDISSLCVFISTIYFQGAWEKTFPVIRTNSADFHLLSGDKIKCNMMALSDTSMPYYETETFQIVRIPYKGHQVGFYVLLPTNTTSFVEFLSQITYTSWDDWRSKMKAHKLDLKMPRMSIKHTENLEGILKALGLANLFTFECDFSHMTEAHIRLDQIIMQSTLDINEEGTIATSAMFAYMSLGISKKIVVEINHPFVCLIHDEKTNTILFMGMVMKPV